MNLNNQLNNHQLLSYQDYHIHCIYYMNILSIDNQRLTH